MIQQRNQEPILVFPDFNILSYFNNQSLILSTNSCLIFELINSTISIGSLPLNNPTYKFGFFSIKLCANGTERVY
ncbi:hypothetical protein V202x_37920 [Gimesia aquarii]|uniref:Uncharacterized protein n=1 Tax=Gimesia aquarii TaxID=2527964 RepID=A0A517WYR0_9PLAN|nr:hypothetical protein V202x_37920 [Gimesia aquarii]